MTKADFQKGIEPALLAKEEIAFLLDHIGEVPAVAKKSLSGSNANPAAVMPIIERIAELIELERVDGEKWIGIDLVKEGLNVYLADRARSEKESARQVKPELKNIALFPTLYSFDGKGRAHEGGTGSDSSYQRTYFDPKDKKRKPLFIDFQPSNVEDWKPSWLEGVREAPKELLIDHDKMRIECLLCNHAESYRKDSNASYSAAMARMSKHMKDPKNIDPELHAEYRLNVFGAS